MRGIGLTLASFMLRLLILEKNEWVSSLFLVANNTSWISSFEMDSNWKVKKKGRIFLKEHDKDTSLFFESDWLIMQE